MPSSTLDTDFQAHLIALVGGTANVSENVIPEDRVVPSVWWQRRTANTDVFLSGQPILNETNYDVEVYSTNIDQAASVADTLKDSLNGYFGVMGTSRVLGSFVEEANDDYIPKAAIADDTGLHNFSFFVRMIA